MKALFGALLVALVPSCTSSLPAFPQATIVVDTDVPVPELATHLRVDVLDGQGTWRSTRDFALRSAADLPASFTVFLPDDQATGDVIVRLRLRPDDAERDYRGERYRAAPADDAAPASVAPVPAGDDQPRLVVNGEDRTPNTEPLPEVTIDRLLRVHLTPGTNRSARVLLTSACAGIMADVVNLVSCLDDAHRASPAPSDDRSDDGTPSVAGSTLRSESLAPPTPTPAAVGIRGGAFVLGGSALGDDLRGSDAAPSAPPRLAIVRGFAIDREEASVARIRAFATTFVGSVPHANNGPLATTSSNPLASCTYRDEPDPADPERERLPATCVPFSFARAFCQHEGGDLPTEAQWEYAASAAGRARKTRYAWGNAEPTCAGVLFARGDSRSGLPRTCNEAGFSFGLRGAGSATEDVTPDGVRGMGGAASEWVRGAPLPYDSACYLRAGLVDPLCDVASDTLLIRGGSFASAGTTLDTTFRGRVPAGGNAATIGFRCAYER